MMDQVSGGGVTGILPKLKGGPSRLDDGKVAGITIPELSTSTENAAQGFHPRLRDERDRRPDRISPVRRDLPGYGSAWKKRVKSHYVAQARVWIAGGEMLARKENFVEIDPEVKDHWGIPVLKIHFTHCDNDRKIIADFQQRAEELFRKAGGEVDAQRAARRPRRFSRRPWLARRAGAERPPRRPAARDVLGGSIHEVGTARMSVSPKEGVLNSFCQTHDIPNLYVFGGNAFPSTGDKHPTLTMMALAARGCDHLVESAR